MQVRSNLNVVMDHSCPMLESECSEQIIAEDASESQPTTKLEIMSELQEASRPMTIHSSLATINVVCDKITTKDLQKSP